VSENSEPPVLFSDKFWVFSSSPHEYSTPWIQGIFLKRKTIVYKGETPLLGSEIAPETPVQGSYWHNRKLLNRGFS